MAEMMQIPSSLMAVARALGMTGENFLNTRQQGKDRQRAKDMEDLQTFLALMPYMQSGQAPPQQSPVTQDVSFKGIPGLSMAPDVIPASAFAPPQQPQQDIFSSGKVQDIVSRLTGMKSPQLGLTPEMRRSRTEADVSARTADSRVTVANKQPQIIDSELRNNELAARGKEYDLGTTPIKDKQTYITKEAGNYVANVISPEVPATDKNRSKLISQAYQNFVQGAPDTPYKKSVRPDDFAGAVDDAIMQEKKYQLDKRQVDVAATRASNSGTPDYMAMANQMRMTLQQRMKDMADQNKQLFGIITMRDANSDAPVPLQLKAEYDKYMNLRRASDNLLSIQADVMGNGGIPSKQGMAMLSETLGIVNGGAPATSTPKPDGAIDDIIVNMASDKIKGRDPVAQKAWLAAEVRKGNLSQVEADMAFNRAKGGK